jgi:hypothetical protein
MRLVLRLHFARYASGFRRTRQPIASQQRLHVPGRRTVRKPGRRDWWQLWGGDRSAVPMTQIDVVTEDLHAARAVEGTVPSQDQGQRHIRHIRHKGATERAHCCCTTVPLAGSGQGGSDPWILEVDSEVAPTDC